MSARLNPALEAPRKAMTPAQIGLLRQFDTYGPASKARGGWMLGGRFIKLATARPLVTLDLLGETFRNGRHKLGVTYTGRAVLQTLSETRGASTSSR